MKLLRVALLSLMVGACDAPVEKGECSFSAELKLRKSDAIPLDYTLIRKRVGKDNFLPAVFERLQSWGCMPSQHSFQIGVNTQHKGVQIPDHLRKKHPDELWLILQYKFANVRSNTDSVSFTVWFDGQPAQLEIPYSSVFMFVDDVAGYTQNME